MRKHVKDIIEISEYTPLDALIQQLQSFRTSLSEEAYPEVAIRGDDFFGQRLTITYCRELTDEEAALEERYSAASDRAMPGPGAPPMSATRGRSGRRTRH